MTVHVCSLISNHTQSVPGGGGYHILRFPFGAGESYDGHGMHQMVQPDGYEIVDWDSDDRSGLIWPAADGWGELTANIHWEDGNYSELRDRFVRDPLGLSTGPDSTATDHRPPSPGMQCFTKTHGIFVHPGTPLALLVGHTDSRSRRIVHAQFKLAVHT
ncbi:hypothetical protein GCM10009801_59840 [Streptomyces albiaxialis]|uniref:Uncharacterized protein n=1 Tax=Streptomyces albiaxialis TaxID=329523 RepID=A0ABN2WI27_9ACTN